MYMYLTVRLSIAKITRGELNDSCFSAVKMTSAAAHASRLNETCCKNCSAKTEEQYFKYLSCNWSSYKNLTSSIKDGGKCDTQTCYNLTFADDIFSEENSSFLLKARRNNERGVCGFHFSPKRELDAICIALHEWRKSHWYWYSLFSIKRKDQPRTYVIHDMYK